MEMRKVTATRILRIGFLVWLIATAGLLVHIVRRPARSVPEIRRNLLQPRANDLIGMQTNRSRQNAV
jgi:hypothetical protein